MRTLAENFKAMFQIRGAKQFPKCIVSRICDKKDIYQITSSNIKRNVDRIQYSSQYGLKTHRSRWST